jgi:hypothetical protein
LFRNEFSFVSYKKWGVMELWEGGRFSGEPPRRQRADACIEVWFNWSLHSTHKSYEAAERAIADLLKEAPAPLHDLADYLVLRSASMSDSPSSLPITSARLSAAPGERHASEEARRSKRSNDP